MKLKNFCIPLLLFILLNSINASGQSIDIKKLKKIRPRMYLAKGLVWKGESAQNTNWNKICQTPDGKIWFSGGDHWGTDGVPRPFDKKERYERPWGFGNTTVCYYDPNNNKVVEAFELNRASSIYSNAETPGHGKIHASIIADSRGNLYSSGYLGSSFNHEYTQGYFPKSYVGGSVFKYNPKTKEIGYFGIPYFTEALIALYLDEKRNILNGLTVNGKFFRLNIKTMELFRYGTVGRMTRTPDRIREMIMDNNGCCYFNNAIGGLTKFDPASGKFTDIDITLPGKLKDFRATVVSSDNVIYAISNEGFVWSYAPETNKFANLGHIFGLPEHPIYTPNIALDEKRNRLYFLASNHGGGRIEEALGTITILDLNTEKYHWMGMVDGFEGCFGALAAKDHNVYFSCLGYAYEKDGFQKGPSGRPITRPYLLKYEPPSKLDSSK